MKARSVVVAFLLIATITFACGGEKKEESPMTRQPSAQIQQDDTSSGFDWESLPFFPGLTVTNSRNMPGNRGYAQFEIQILSSTENARTILDFYEQQMPGTWTFSEETKLDDGFQGKWESSTEQSTLWIRVTKSKTGQGSELEIIYGKKE